MDDMTRSQSSDDRTVVGAPVNADGSSTRQNGEDEINLADYLRVISKHRRMIFRICAVTVIATAIISLLLPKIYEATASVVPPVDTLQRESMFASALNVMKSPILQQTMDISNISDMYIDILQSRSIADTLIGRFNLGEVYHMTRYISDVRVRLAKNTSFIAASDGIVTITVDDRDPCRAAALANAYVEELDRQNKRLFVGQATNKKVFLDNRLREIKQELSQIDSILSRDAKIKELLFELLTQEYEIAKIEEAKSMPTIQVLDTAVVPEKESKPRRLLMIFIAGITSLFIGIFAAFIREYFARDSLRGTKP